MHLSLDQGIDTPSPVEEDRLFVNDTRTSGLTQTSHSHKILVVDDEQDIVFTLKTILNEAGFSVDAFTNPSVAFEMFRPEKYELLILDIRMPGINGFELYRRIKESNPHMKIVFITAFEINKEEFTKVIPSVDVLDFISKPVSMSTLINKLNSILKYID